MLTNLTGKFECLQLENFVKSLTLVGKFTITQLETIQENCKYQLKLENFQFIQTVIGLNQVHSVSIEWNVSN